MLENSPVDSRKVSIADIFFQSKELERQGIDVIHLDVGEPDYPSPSEVVHATSMALENGKTRYTGPGGIPELRNEIARHVSLKYGVNVTSNQVLFTAGGRFALFLAFASLPKDSKVGIICPDWPAYRDLCEFFSIKVRFFNTTLENFWLPDLGEIENSGCTALILNYPNNPTGKILDTRFFDKLVQLCSSKKMKLISDEVYSDFALNEVKFKSLIESGISPDHIFTTSMSKSYSMTGYRAGYLISKESTIARLSELNGLVLTSAPEFVQYGAISALRNDSFVSEKVELLRRRRTIACKALEDERFEFYPSDGSLYLFPKLNSLDRDRVDSGQFARELLEKEHVSVTPGTVFGPGYSQFIRITLLQNEKRIQEGIERISHLLNQPQGMR